MTKCKKSEMIGFYMFYLYFRLSKGDAMAYWHPLNTTVAAPAQTTRHRSTGSVKID